MSGLFMPVEFAVKCSMTKDTKESATIVRAEIVIPDVLLQSPYVKVSAQDVLHKLEYTVSKLRLEFEQK